MKKLLVVLAVMMMFATPAFAGFTNGGFESGDFNGWTKANGYWNGGSSYSSSASDLGKSAIVGAGLDPYTNNNLNRVYSDSYAARVNNYDDSYHYSSITQTVNNWQDDSIYFAWTAIMEEPGNYHGDDNAPHFSLLLTDDVLGVIYSKEYNVYNYPNWKDGYYDGYNQWKYLDWQVVQLNTAANKGHNLTLTLLASDCSWGGHGGYAYLDGFGADIPIQNDVVPEPASLSLLGLGLVGLLKRKRV